MPRACHNGVAGWLLYVCVWSLEFPQGKGTQALESKFGEEEGGHFRNNEPQLNWSEDCCLKDKVSSFLKFSFVSKLP